MYSEQFELDLDRKKSTVSVANCFHSMNNMINAFVFLTFIGSLMLVYFMHNGLTT